MTTPENAGSTDSSNSSHSSLPSLLSDESERLFDLAEEVVAAEVQAELDAEKRYQKIPCRTSVLRGWMYEKELLEGSPVRFLEVLRLEKRAFKRLMTLLGPALQPSRHVTINEQVMIFLFIVGHAVSFRHAAERFQHSTETCHRYFHIVREALENLAPTVIVSPGPDAPLPDEIADSGKFFPWFKRCIGAIDGTHIEAKTSFEDHAKYRNRKGGLSQNVLAGCSFDMKFVFIYAGIAGSATDSFVMSKARENGAWMVPEGRFYLGDAGYAHRPDLFIPYRGVRYHLQEWQLGNRAPRDAQELFNLRHSMLRNVVERIFGVMKVRCKVMQHMPNLKLDHQFSLVVACAVLHNIIRDSGPEDAVYEEYDEEVREEERKRAIEWANNRAEFPLDVRDDVEDLAEASLARDIVAEAMFSDFLNHPRRHWL